MSEPTIGTGYARALLDLAVSKGAARDQLIRRSGIDPAALSDPDLRIPIAAFIALMRSGKELCRDPALALHFGEAYDIAELSIVGLLGQTSNTFGDAFAQLNRYSRLIDDAVPADADRLVLSRKPGGVWLIDRRRNSNEFPELTESSFARMVCSTRRFVTDRPLVKSVHVTYPAPDYLSEYDRVFRVPVVFESDKNALLLADDAWRTQSTCFPSDYLSRVLGERAEGLLEALDRTRSVRRQVEDLLAPVLHTADAGMDSIAARMGVARSTLSRRLHAEGTSFETVRDNLRKRLATDLMSRKQASIKEAAYRLGFSDATAFSRAFKRWTGSSPRAFQDARR